MPRTGRRPGKVDTRGDILAAARDRFASNGYTGATIRSIAAAAEVDPALVHHYFGTKRQLFAATLDLPLDPTRIVQAVVADGPDRAGELLIRSYLAVWDDEEGRTTLVSMLRSALTDERVMRMLREFMLGTVVAPIVGEVAPDRHELRATLVASQVIGLAIVRYVAEVEPLASAPVEEVVVAIAPGLQRYLTGEVVGGA